jgi:hypothetical protein
MIFFDGLIANGKFCCVRWRASDGAVCHAGLVRGRQSSPEIVVVDVEGTGQVLVGVAKWLTLVRPSWLIEFRSEPWETRCAMLGNASYRVELHRTALPGGSAMWFQQGWV